MRNIIINKEQERILLEAIQQDYVLSKVSNKIKNDIATDNTPLSCLSIPHNLNKKVITSILTNGYFNARDNFSDNIESFPTDRIINKLDKLVAICQKKEEKIHNELEKLCVDIATSYFNSDELLDVTLECRLVMDLSQNDFHIEPSMVDDNEISSLDENDKSDIAISNRKIANAIVMGGALSLYDKLQETFISELFKLDEDLPHLYSKILKINEYLTYISDETITDRDNKQSGCVKVTLGGEEGDEIVAVGTIFPFLLIETFRGYLELMSDNMLPDNDFDVDEITDKADILIDEPWYMMLGRTLWEKIVRGEDDDLTIISELFKMDETSFYNLMTNVIVGTHDVESMLGTLYQTARYNHDYADFEKDLADRREENNLIVDNEDLIDEEANYPENFNIEEFKNIRTFTERVKYCKSRLKYLGKGSARIVFQIDDSTVLKLAWNNKGVAQNEAEASVKNDYVMSGYNFLPEVYDVDENYLWIEMQIARKAKKSDFKRLTGYNWETFYYWVTYCAIRTFNMMFGIPNEYKQLFNSSKWSQTLQYEHTIFGEIEDFITNYDVKGWHDICAIRNWGVARNANGNEELVLIDNGLDNNVIDKYYKE